MAPIWRGAVKGCFDPEQTRRAITKKGAARGGAFRVANGAQFVRVNGAV